MTNEIWKDIEGYNGQYQVSNLGRVKSFKRGGQRILKEKKNHRGYVRVGLYSEGQQQFFFIHRLVAFAFCDGYKEGLQVDHINGIKTDNKAINLRWLTIRQNHESYRSNKSIYGIGIKKTPSGRFRCLVHFKGKLNHIGTYDTPEQAQQARTDFKTRHNIK